MIVAGRFARALSLGTEKAAAGGLRAPRCEARPAGREKRANGEGGERSARAWPVAERPSNAGRRPAHATPNPHSPVALDVRRVRRRGHRERSPAGPRGLLIRTAGARARGATEPPSSAPRSGARPSRPIPPKTPNPSRTHHARDESAWRPRKSCPRLPRTVPHAVLMRHGCYHPHFASLALLGIAACGSPAPGVQTSQGGASPVDRDAGATNTSVTTTSAAISTASTTRAAPAIPLTGTFGLFIPATASGPPSEGISYTGTSLDYEAMWQNMCAQSDCQVIASCPSGAVGRCTGGQVGVGIVLWYYPPETAEGAASDCATGDGTWTPTP